MKLMNIFIINALLLVQAIALAGGNESEDYKEIMQQLEPCEKARYEIGSEINFVMLTSTREQGNNGCQIFLLFESKENVEKFRSERVKKSLNPDSMIFREKKIKFRMEVGDVELH